MCFGNSTELEDINNSTIIIKTKEAKNKNIFIIGSYREWRHLGGPPSTSTEGIKLQKIRIIEISRVIEKVTNLHGNHTIIWGGDLNCDQNLNNDNMTRPDLRVVSPI